MPFLTFSIFSSLKGSPTMGIILRLPACRYRGGAPSDPRGSHVSSEGHLPLSTPNRLATLSTEADLELAYCCTSTPVPLRARGRQERISAQEAGALLGSRKQCREEPDRSESVQAVVIGQAAGVAHRQRRQAGFSTRGRACRGRCNGPSTCRERSDD